MKMSATGIPDYARLFGPRLAEFLHVRSHYPYRCDFARPGEGPGAAAARVLEEAIVREGPDTVAAFLARMRSGRDGSIPTVCRKSFANGIIDPPTPPRMKPANARTLRSSGDPARWIGA